MHDGVRRAPVPWVTIVATYSGGTDFSGSASSGFTENVSLGHFLDVRVWCIPPPWPAAPER